MFADAPNSSSSRLATSDGRPGNARAGAVTCRLAGLTRAAQDVDRRNAELDFLNLGGCEPHHAGLEPPQVQIPASQSARVHQG